MYFNSYAFLTFISVLYALFIVVSYVASRKPLPRYTVHWLLILGSLFFYGYWKVPYVGLLAGSIVFNYIIGEMIAKGRRPLLWLGLLVNLGLLAYFKYAKFIVTDIFHAHSSVNILLPIGISFFTFQQIAYLVDAYRGKAVRQQFAQYALFISFFAHLISGPLVMQQNIVPQLTREKLKPSLRNFLIGLSAFTLGLFKKVMIADNISPYVDTVFKVAHASANLGPAPAWAGTHLGFLAAWLGSIGFGLQIYFDFSGYGDMAIGLALLFNIRFPINFYSPYKSSSIIEFWHRWNITLSKFLRDYLYIPLGGNRKGALRRYANIMLVMLIGGLWHGASWMFVCWGGLHGIYLLVNHGFRAICARSGIDRHMQKPPFRMLGVVLTFVAATLAWVMFKADAMSTGIAVYKAMFDTGLGLRELQALYAGGNFAIDYGADRANLAAIFIGLFIVFAFPNTAQILQLEHSDDNKKYFTPIRSPRRLHWRPVACWGLAMGAILALALLGLSETPREFIYFQF